MNDYDRATGGARAVAYAATRPSRLQPPSAVTQFLAPENLTYLEGQRAGAAAEARLWAPAFAATTLEDMPVPAQGWAAVRALNAAFLEYLRAHVDTIGATPDDYLDWRLQELIRPDGYEHYNDYPLHEIRENTSSMNTYSGNASAASQRALRAPYSAVRGEFGSARAAGPGAGRMPYLNLYQEPERWGHRDTAARSTLADDRGGGGDNSNGDDHLAQFDPTYRLVRGEVPEDVRAGAARERAARAAREDETCMSSGSAGRAFGYTGIPIWRRHGLTLDGVEGDIAETLGQAADERGGLHYGQRLLPRLSKQYSRNFYGKKY